jgi:hypothetical protein
MKETVRLIMRVLKATTTPPAPIRSRRPITPLASSTRKTPEHILPAYGSRPRVATAVVGTAAADTAALEGAAAAVALAWTIRNGKVIVRSPAHVKENAVTLSLTLKIHLADFSVNPSEAVYVGDSGGDMRMAKGAVALAWGAG